VPHVGAHCADQFWRNLAPPAESPLLTRTCSNDVKSKMLIATEHALDELKALLLAQSEAMGLESALVLALVLWRQLAS
jgi:hypothetical protein